MQSTPPQVQPPTLRLSQAAKRIGIHPDTLRQWADKGQVACVRLPSGERRFRVADIEALIGHAA